MTPVAGNIKVVILADAALHSRGYQHPILSSRTPTAKARGAYRNHLQKSMRGK